MSRPLIPLTPEQRRANRLETYRRSKAKKAAQLQARRTQTEEQLAAILREHRGPEERRRLIEEVVKGGRHA